MLFEFTTGIDVDTLESVVIMARADTPTTCTLELLDSHSNDQALMGSTQSKLKPNEPTKLIFPKPIPLLNSHGATPYILSFTFSNNTQVSVAKATRPDQRVKIGNQLYRDTELTGSVIGRLVDTRGYTLMLTPVYNGFIYGRTALLNKLRITPPYSQDDIATMGAYTLKQSKALENSAGRSLAQKNTT